MTCQPNLINLNEKKVMRDSRYGINDLDDKF